MGNQAIVQASNTYKVEGLHPTQRNISLTLLGFFALISLIVCINQLISLYQWATTFNACQANPMVTCSSPTSNSLFLITIMPAYFMLNFAVINNTRVISSPQGIEYRAGYFTLHTTWDNLKGIKKAKVGLGSKAAYEYLSLAEPAKVGGIFGWLVTAQQARKIPLSVEDKWRSSQFERELQYYAPQLFSQDETQLSQATSPLAI